MRALRLTLVYLIVITLFQATKIAIGRDGVNQLIEALFGPYIEYWAIHGPTLSIPLSHPIVMLVGIVLFLPFILRMGAILRHVGAFVIALTIFRIVGWTLGVPTIEPPRALQLAMALATIFGLVLLGAISRRSRRFRLLESVRQRIS